MPAVLRVIRSDTLLLRNLPRKQCDSALKTYAKRAMRNDKFFELEGEYEVSADSGNGRKPFVHKLV